MYARVIVLVRVLVAISGVLAGRAAYGQSYGVEFNNSLMPASGGMGGTSVARPQDFLSGINGNPATLTQYHGTQFTLGGAFADASFSLTQSAPAPLIGVTPYAARSGTPGAIIPNIGVSQELSAYGLPVTFGLALIGSAGAGTSFLTAPESNGTSSYLLVLNFAPSVAVRLTDRLSVGGTMFVGDGYLNGPFVGVSSMTNAYALRAGLGVGYELTDDTTLGFYWKTKQRFNFKDSVVLFNNTTALDVPLALPEQFGLGIANSRLLDGRLLLAADVLFMHWTSADLFEDIYRDQWIMQLGMQYTIRPQIKLRAGYALAGNPINPSTGTTVDGIVVPGGIPAVNYLQAQYGVVNEHRLSIGVGFSDVLPGVDFDLFAGGMFPASQQFGEFTSINISSYWVGAGLSWRFGRGSCLRS